MKKLCSLQVSKIKNNGASEVRNCQPFAIRGPGNDRLSFGGRCLKYACQLTGTPRDQQAMLFCINQMHSRLLFVLCQCIDWHRLQGGMPCHVAYGECPCKILAEARHRVPLAASRNGMVYPMADRGIHIQVILKDDQILRAWGKRAPVRTPIKLRDRIFSKIVDIDWFVS